MVWDLATLEQETGISIAAKKLKLLRALDSRMMTHEIELPVEEISGVQDLLVECIGDMDINKQLNTLAPYARCDTGISATTLDVIKDISYRTRHLNKILHKMKDLWTDFERAKAENASLQDNEKISLEQFGILYDLAYLNKKLTELDKLGFIAGNEQLEILYSHSQHAALMIKHVDDTFDTKFRAPVGSMVFDKAENKSKILGKSLGFCCKLITFCITKFAHASSVVFVENETAIVNKISHIDPCYAEIKFSLRNFLYSDVYKIKLENLITKNTQSLLKEKLGDDWLVQLEKKYATIERDLHDGARGRYIHVSAAGGFIRDAEIATVLLQGGHMNFFMKNHSNKDIRDHIFGRGIWENENKESCKMLCSEFVGMTTIAAIQELNDVVKQALLDKGVDNIPKTLIKSPFSKKEKLHLLTPERLLTAMQERGAVEKVVAPVELSKFVATGP